MPPLVSVIIPCFNAGRMLEPSLRSAFAQTYPNLEIIFVDNNSTDGSGERAQSIAAGYGRPFRLLRCVPQGGNHARILGYGAANGDYIQWLDADDALGLEKIAQQMRALETVPGASIAYCDRMVSRHQPDGRRVDKVERQLPMEDQILRTLCGIWYPPHAYLLRRAAADVLAAEQAWFPSRKVGQDVEYSAIAAMLGLRFLHVPEARVQYNIWSPTQVSHSEADYPLRVATFRDIWIRLRDLAQRPDVAHRIGPLHHFLLDEDWTIWRTANDSTARPAIEREPREAAIANAIAATRQSLAIPHFALLVAAQIPALNGDIPFIVATLRRLREQGRLVAA